MKTDTKTKAIIVFYTISTLILIWLFVSWVDVIRHNMLGDETYQYWIFNFFRIFGGR